MSEKQKSSVETTEKVMTKYDKKIQKRKEQERKEANRKKVNRVIGAFVALVLVAFIAYFPISKYVATHSTYASIGEYDLTEVEFDYYYNAGINDYISQYGSYLTYLGLDTSKDLATQMYSETMTWAEFFQQNAISGITRTKALISEAKANGFEHDTTDEVADHMETLKSAATNAEMTVDSYVKSFFGQYATIKNIVPFVEDSYYAAAYYESVADSKPASEEEITAYYEDNKNSYDSVDFKLIEVLAEIPEGEATTDADGNATTAEPTEEQIAAAMEVAKAEADEKEKTIDKDGELKENKKSSSLSSLYMSWLFDETRKAGDTTVVEDTTNNKYYVLRFEARYLDQTATANARIIYTSEDKGSAIIDEWNSTGANEEAFIKLVEAYSEDTYSNKDGGLYENLVASNLDGELGVWLMDDARQVGDVTSILDEEGSCYVMYYVGAGDPEWKSSIANTLLSQTMSAYLTEITAKYDVVDKKGNLTYLKAIEEAERLAAESDTSTEVTN